MTEEIQTVPPDSEGLTLEGILAEINLRRQSGHSKDELRAFLSEFDMPEDEINKLIKATEPAPKFDPKKGQRRAYRVNPQAVERCRLKNYPEYQIDAHGAVYNMDGKLISPRWRNGKCWVNLYTHDGKRVCRNVYWLLVDAGFVVLSEKQRAYRKNEKSEGNTTSI
jgi:hypothetical protein